MEDKQLIVHEENFITKIKNFFRSLFKSKEEQNISVLEIAENKETVFSQRENEFLNDIKVDSEDINKFIGRNNFLEYINGNVEALKLLSVERLRKLEEYYDNIIKENEIKIEKLKRKV